MIDFVSFSVTLPYPTLKTLLLYLIVGELLVFYWMCRACIVTRQHLILDRAWWVKPAVVGVGVALWPWIVFEDVRRWWAR